MANSSSSEMPFIFISLGLTHYCRWHIDQPMAKPLEVISSIVFFDCGKHLHTHTHICHQSVQKKKGLLSTERRQSCGDVKKKNIHNYFVALNTSFSWRSRWRDINQTIHSHMVCLNSLCYPLFGRRIDFMMEKNNATQKTIKTWTTSIHMWGTGWLNELRRDEKEIWDVVTLWNKKKKSKPLISE